MVGHKIPRVYFHYLKYVLLNNKTCNATKTTYKAAVLKYNRLMFSEVVLQGCTKEVLHVVECQHVCHNKFDEQFKANMLQKCCKQ